MISRAAYRQYFRGVLAYDLKASKSPVIVFSTLNADNALDMAEEMGALAKRSKRVQKPCAHFCFSLAPGEVLTAEQWADFFAAVVEEFGALQAVGITHADTPQVNAHLVMNRVKADGKAWSTSNDRHRLRALCLHYEKMFGLRILPTESDALRVSKTEIEKADRLYRQHKAPTPIPARVQLAETIRATLATATNPDDFTYQLADQGINVRWRVEEGNATGISYALGEVCISGKSAGITVRTIRDRFNYESTRSLAPSSTAPALARHPQGAATSRTHRPKHGINRPAIGDGKAARGVEDAERNYADDGGDATPAAQPPALTTLLHESLSYGRLGLLGLLDLAIAGAHAMDRPRILIRPYQDHPFSL